MKEKIEKFLRENIEKEFEKHGGGVQVEEYSDGVLKVRMKGKCINCPSAIAEIETFVFEEVQKKFPEIKKITLNTGVSDELLEFGKRILKREKEK